MIGGPGLHRGQPGAVRFVRADAPVRLRANGHEARIADLVPDGSARSTVVRAGGLEVATVEHLFAALEARALRTGLVIEVDGPEIPLVDGGAAAFADALAAFDVPAAPRAVITRAATFEVGASRYELRPGPDVDVTVDIDFDDARIARSASWRGDAKDFRVRIAPARTFGFARELGELLARGLAQHVPPESVVVFADDAVHAAGRAYEPDEPARHKLLDLLGDLYVHGGVPRGHFYASRPGHAATHEAMRRARAEGVVAWT